MKNFLRSKLILSLVAIVMIAAAIAIPLSGSITHSFAASRSSHNIAYVNYDDSGFTGSAVRTGNIFADSIVNGPAPTGSNTASVTYNGMIFTPLAEKALSTSTLAPYDTLILFEVCDIATSLSASQHAAINAFLAAGNKILLYDADRCAPISAGGGAAGSADYSWFTFPFSTSNPGPQGASGKLTIVEQSTLTTSPNILAHDPFNLDELGDANTATTSNPNWFAAAKTTNALGVNGFFLAYARNKGLIIYDGADHWNTDQPTQSLTDLFVNELDQQYDPDNLPSTTPIASRHTLFVLLQGLSSELTPLQESRNEHPGFNQSNGIIGYLTSKKGGFGTADFLEYSYPVDFPKGTPSSVKQEILSHEHFYSCLDTFDHSLNQDVRTLDLQIRAYLQELGHQNTDVYLIGDSLGGVIGFGYLALLKTQGWPSLPNGGHLKGVVTLDAPLGGIPPRDLLATQFVFNSKLHCLGNHFGSILPLTELVSVFDTTRTATPLGGTANLTKVIFPKFIAPSGFDNQKLAEEANSHNAHVLTIGNEKDFGFALSGCDVANFLGLRDFLSSQFVRDEGVPSGVYARAISVSKFSFCTIDAILNEINHGEALTSLTVEKGIVNFINNNDPSPLLTPSQLLA